MYKAFYQGSELMALPILAMLVFLVAFTAMLVRVLLARHGSGGFDQAARLPLGEDAPRATKSGGEPS